MTRAGTEPAPTFVAKLEAKDRHTVSEIDRLTRLHNRLAAELRRARSGEAEGVVAARLAGWGIRV